MKIGTITFHWANNYGAVLQTYALQKFLKNNKIDTEVINYVPSKLYFREVLRDYVRRNKNNIQKRKYINTFINNEVALSKKKYGKYKNLCSTEYNAVITGSDQIWNEWFLFNSEKAPNLSYYLGFCKENCKRISYAASFGTERLKLDTVNTVKPQLEKFAGISVRENTGKQIIEDLGLKAVRVCDPTLLLERDIYEEMIKNINPLKNEDYIFSYVLRNDGGASKRVIEEVQKQNGINEFLISKNSSLDVYQWLLGIKNSSFVVTNSFHATVFALLFHKPFFTVPVQGKNMNDRIVTLLNDVGLSARFGEFNGEQTKSVFEPIDWDLVDNRIKKIRKESSLWLINCIKS